ncbi:MAG: transposase, partial [Rhodomicrobium sp.]
MTFLQCMPKDTVLVAIDVSKLRNDVLIELPGKSRRRRLTVLNSRAEHDRFVNLLRDLGLPVTIGFEATGNYHRPLAYRLLESQYAKEAFIEEAWDVVGRKVSKARLLADIYETAQSSIGLPVPADSAALSMFKMVLTEGRSLIRQRDAIERQAHTALANTEDYQRLRQGPGIGPITAMTILAEAGDLRRFRHHRQFLKFCGLDLATHQSGQFRGQTKLSKFGNAR